MHRPHPVCTYSLTTPLILSAQHYKTIEPVHGVCYASLEHNAAGNT